MLPGARDRIHLAHMQSIVVPSFTITNATMQEAVGALQDASIKFDPNRGTGKAYGFGFIVQYSVDPNARSNPFSVESPTKPVTPRISVSETNRSLHYLIEKCCDQANMMFRLDNGNVMIQEKTDQQKN
jgi:hypothetical protein